ncbi:MAG: AbrB/MazE/SpoVT family DNA-binding domain-containing protein [archaeon YNP-LCB-003-016]|uniref:AbrB/MazE/SpoVT family DNA-binding domain-containing protein n=1 Tax=Candidatus Culexarchaeum yellowstonense TaxID=2928963 RepID=UPI0026ECD9DD|nr:AbrB/MazE/SpoVT family DNA-binding domain-containing protein [Candidatus Culexarchaeum yellowstonense]MCR6692753.1 AbrB/MazE/SpoVT family DNA-binding domain-containing protein [Candidatus Culexarchaeum yellowstonense]
MEFSRVSRKFLVSIPAKVRKALGLEVGDILMWDVEGDKVIVRVMKKSVKALRGKYDDPSLTYDSVEEKADELLMKEVKR